MTVMNCALTAITNTKALKFKFCQRHMRKLPGTSGLVGWFSPGILPPPLISDLSPLSLDWPE